MFTASLGDCLYIRSKQARVIAQQERERERTIAAPGTNVRGGRERQREKKPRRECIFYCCLEALKMVLNF